MTIEFRYGHTNDGEAFINPNVPLPIRLLPGENTKAQMKLPSNGLLMDALDAVFGSDTRNFDVSVQADVANNGALVTYRGGQNGQTLVVDKGQEFSKVIEGFGFSVKDIQE